MKSLHRPDLFAWSAFDTARDVDFSGTLWTGPQGNVAFDPMPLSEHDHAHATALGGIQWIAITNADHVRDAVAIGEAFGASIAAPAGDRGRPDFDGVPVARWLDEGDTLCAALALRLHGSKTPGELAFLLGDTLICGDLVRGQRAGALNLLPTPKLADPAAARASVARLADLPGLVAVLVGDGQSVFERGAEHLRAAL